VAVVIAHELGHQWFGNLVTAAWWSQLWLNEGFATYVEYIGSGQSNPELLMADQFISVAQRQALVFDSSSASHPIINNATMTGSFDTIDYAKGGSVLRMMRGMLGESVFMTGVRQYLQHFQYSNAYSTDLFTELTAAAAAAGQTVNVTEIMSEWTAVAGYPLVSCTTSVGRVSGDSVQWSCTQSRFYSYSEPSPASTKWTIHVTATTAPSSPAAVSPMWWPATQSTPLTFTVPVNTPYVKLNTNTTGFFRVHYDQASYQALSIALMSPAFGGLHHDDRLGLINDVFPLAAKGLVSYPTALNLSLFLQNELSFPVWQVAHPALLDIYNRIKYNDTGAKPLYQQYMQQLMTHAAQHLNITTVSGAQSAADVILESTLALSILRFNAGGRADQLSSRFVDLYDGLTDITQFNPNLIDLVLEAGVLGEGATPAHWLFVYTQFYQQKLATATNTTGMDPLAALGFPAIIVSHHDTLQHDTHRAAC
jgi:glutamyl aminopeptidase